MVGIRKENLFRLLGTQRPGWFTEIGGPKMKDKEGNRMRKLPKAHFSLHHCVQVVCLWFPRGCNPRAEIEKKPHKLFGMGDETQNTPQHIPKVPFGTTKRDHWVHCSNLALAQHPNLE